MKKAIKIWQGYKTNLPLLGIGPSYSSSRSRDGLRIFHIFNKEAFDRQLKILVQGAQKRYGSLTGYDVEKEIAQFDVSLESLLPVMELTRTISLPGAPNKAGSFCG